MDHFILSFLSEVSEELQRLNCTELFINGSRGVFAIDARDTLHQSSLSYSVESLSDCVRYLAFRGGGRIDATLPAGGGFCPEFNLRWHAILSPVAQENVIVSFRRHSFTALALEDFCITSEHLAAIVEAVESRKPILISGPTGSGKTSLLTSILKKWFLNKRVVIVETIPECPSLSPTWIRLCETAKGVNGKGGFLISEIAREVLRMRPDNLVVGELRSAEAKVFFDLSLTGHGGCLSTIHANSIDDVQPRIESMMDEDQSKSIHRLQPFVMHLNRGNEFKIQDVRSL